MLAWREWIRFFRQPHRVIAALGQPILLWILFGTGLHGAFRSGGDENFMTYYLPGTIALILLFTAIFATISIIEDRREGFLQSVLVSAAPRWTIVMGKAIGGGAIAWVQALIFLGLALLVGSAAASASTISLIVLMAVAAIGVTALGVCFAWPMDSTQGFHAVMNLVLMPMWLLSGAFFPIPALADGVPVGQTIIHWMMRLNPMTYPVAGMRQLLIGSGDQSVSWSPSLAACWIVTIAAAILGVIAATFVVRKNKIGDAI
jgi:ABC-2 type transport system permease protein